MSSPGIKLEAPNDAILFLHYYEKIKDEKHSDGSFVDLRSVCDYGDEPLMESVTTAVTE